MTARQARVDTEVSVSTWSDGSVARVVSVLDSGAEGKGPGYCPSLSDGVVGMCCRDRRLLGKPV